MNTLRITRRILAVALVVGALSAPVAAASTFEERFPSLADRETPVGTAPAAESPAAEPSGGFDWGDASIGAAAMLAIMAIGAGGVLEVGRRRQAAAHGRLGRLEPQPAREQRELRGKRLPGLGRRFRFQVRRLDQQPAGLAVGLQVHAARRAGPRARNGRT